MSEYEALAQSVVYDSKYGPVDFGRVLSFDERPVLIETWEMAFEAGVKQALGIYAGTALLQRIVTNLGPDSKPRL